MDMHHSRWLLIVIALLLGASPVFAAEVAYPPGSRIGLVPPDGLVTSKSFFGFEDASNNVAIIMVALPAEAYTDLDKTITADALKRQGLTVESRAAMPLPIGKAFLVIRSEERRVGKG